MILTSMIVKIFRWAGAHQYKIACETAILSVRNHQCFVIGADWGATETGESFLHSSTYICGSDMCQEFKAIKMNKTESLSSKISNATRKPPRGFIRVDLFFSELLRDDHEFKDHLLSDIAHFLLYYLSLVLISTQNSILNIYLIYFLFPPSP